MAFVQDTNTNFAHLNISTSAQPKGRFTRYDFVASNSLRHFLGHDCRDVLKDVLRSYNFFRVVRRLRAAKSHRVNRASHVTN